MGYLARAELNSAVSCGGQAAADEGELNFVSYWPALTRQ
jgi:hypothetical protein